MEAAGRHDHGNHLPNFCFPGVFMPRPTCPAWLVFTLILAAALPRLAQASESQATLHFVSDTYGCLGYEDWPGGIARLQHVMAQQRKADRNSILIHTGNAISPFYYSRYDQGALYSEELDAIGNVIWNIGFHDLDYGWKQLSRLRSNMKATTLLSSNLKAPTDSPQSWVVREVGGIKIGFAGIIDPRASHLTRIGMFKDMQAQDPIETARQILEEHGSEADVRVLVVDLDEADSEKLAREVIGYDFILSGSRHEKDWYSFNEGRPARQVIERTRPDGSRTVLVSGPRDGFQMGKIRLRGRRTSGRFELTGYDHDVIDLATGSPEDQKTWKRVQEQLTRMEKEGGEVILDRLQDRFPEGLDADRLMTWVLGAMRTGSDSEVAILNIGALFKAGFRIQTCWKDDRITGMDLDKTFWTDNHLVKVRVKGSHLLEMLEDDEKEHLRYSGLVKKGGSVTINGRPIKEGEHYLVATSNYIVAQSPKSRQLSMADSVHGKFEIDDGSYEPDDESGSRIVLRDLFRQQLLAWRQEHPEPDGADPFDLPAYPNQRHLRFQNVNASFSDFDARNNELFPRVRNPRIASFDVATSMVNGDIFLEDEDLNRTWANGMIFRFNNLDFSGGTSINPVDDLQLYSRYTDRSRTLGGDSLAFNPFVEVNHDTEFSATTGNPTQKLYRLTLGLAQKTDGPLKGLRLSALMEHDRSLVGNTEYGIRIGYQGSKSFGKFRFESDTRGRYYFDEGNDTADDLRFEVYSDNQLVIPITSEFSVNFMANIFTYEGKVVNATGSNLFLGVGIRFDKLWKMEQEDFNG